MSMSNGHAASSMAGMSMSAGHGAVNILPEWLAIVWTFVFLAIVVLHGWHLFQTHGVQPRLWHTGHVLMALGMAFMYAPSSLDPLNIPAAFWQLAFANGAGLIFAWMFAQVLDRYAFNVLWLLMAVDLTAMVYMWTPSAFTAPLTWLLVAYFSIQALLWATDAYRRVDGRWQIGGGARLSVAGDGTVAISAVRSEPLICNIEMRPSMVAMTLGMAYMFAAMQLML